MKGKLENWVVIPRKIASDKRNGKITSSELFLLLWLRVNGNPYGIATISLKDIHEDIFNNKFTISYVNKLLLSLRSKRYLHYDDRTGRRGSFEVHFGDWILPNGNIRDIDSRFSKRLLVASSRLEEPIESEVSEDLSSGSQSFKEKRDNISKMLKGLSTESVRGSNNDNDNKNNIK